MSVIAAMAGMEAIATRATATARRWRESLTSITAPFASRPSNPSEPLRLFVTLARQATRKVPRLGERHPQLAAILRGWRSGNGERDAAVHGFGDERATRSDEQVTHVVVRDVLRVRERTRAMRHVETVGVPTDDVLTEQHASELAHAERATDRPQRDHRPMNSIANRGATFAVCFIAGSQSRCQPGATRSRNPRRACRARTLRPRPTRRATPTTARRRPDDPFPEWASAPATHHQHFRAEP